MIWISDSAAICLYPCLDSSANNANHLCILTTIHTKRNAAEYTSQQEKGKTSNVSHSSCNFFWETLSPSTTEGTVKLPIRRKSLVVWLKTLVIWHEALIWWIPCWKPWFGCCWRRIVTLRWGIHRKYLIGSWITLLTVKSILRQSIIDSGKGWGLCLYKLLCGQIWVKIVAVGHLLILYLLDLWLIFPLQLRNL